MEPVPMICKACQVWMEPLCDKEAQQVKCTECGHIEPYRFLPLFIVTGPSGAGKTAVTYELQRLLPEWEVFETDIIWDSGGNWTAVKCNWLRIAAFIAQREPPRPTILCGTMQPKELETCESRPYFSTIHWLALTCEDEMLERRLRARPAWRESTEDFIVESLNYNRWFRENAMTEFSPPLTLVDTTHTTIEQTAQHTRDWAVHHWESSATFLG